MGASNPFVSISPSIIKNTLITAMLTWMVHVFYLLVLNKCICFPL